MNGLNPFRVSIGGLGMLLLIFVINIGRNSISEKLEVEIYGETLKENNRKKVIALKNKKLTALKSPARSPASEKNSQIPSFSQPFSDFDTSDSDQKTPSAGETIAFSGVASLNKKDGQNNKQNSEKKPQRRLPSNLKNLSSTVKVDAKRSVNFTSGIGGGLFQPEAKTSSPSQDIESSPSAVILLSNNTPDGSYLSQPLITLTSSNANLIKYCVGTTASSICCDPDSDGVNYSGPFQLGSTDGNYCLAAKGYTSGLTSSRRNWNYVVDASLVSLNLTLPPRRFFQTQQLFENIAFNSSEFGDSSLTFLQRVSTTDPGVTACETLASSTGLDDMETSLGYIVNFGAVTAPFQVPLLLNNNLNYGMNYLVSIVERLGSSRSPASASNEYVCLQNTIEVKDFHVEEISASKGQAFPVDGSYGFQGQLNTLGSGKALGANGITLEYGILNIIN